MKLQELRKIIREEIKNIKTTQVIYSVNKDGEATLLFPEDTFNDFFLSDKNNKYTSKHYSPNSTILWTDTIKGNRNYIEIKRMLDKYKVPYKERSARLDNSVRFMVDVSNLKETFSVEVGKPTPNAIFPVGNSYTRLSTGTLVDMGESINHPSYPKLTPEEHQEVADKIKNHLKGYKEEFGGTKWFNNDVYDMAIDNLKQHLSKSK